MKSILRLSLLLSLALFGLCVEIAAQGNMHVVSGVVRDANTGRKLSQASITTIGGHEATVTNVDGRFTLKTVEKPHFIVVSCLGYNAIRLSLDGQKVTDLKVKLTPGTITLEELIVTSMDPKEIVLAAMAKVPDNYSRNNELMRCFYRETTQKGRRYIDVAEAVTLLYKSGYNKKIPLDRVAIEKGRQLISERAADTLGAKMRGGPALAVHLDLVKIPELLLSNEELDFYKLQMEIPVTIDGRPQMVISFAPAYITDHVLYNGKIYIDRQTLTFTRIEMSLDMRDELRATACMLLHKPAGVRFKPREMKTTVAYRMVDGVSRMHYIHSDVRFYCEWKKKLFASPYHVEAEMVVTDLVSEDAKPIPAREAFSSHDAYYDKAKAFSDPNFWEDYNIIEPSESLEHAVHKLKKK